MNNNSRIKTLLTLASSLSIAVLITACGGNGGDDEGGGTTPPPQSSECTDGPGVTISWSANKETSVNRSGGGYTVYYSKTSTADPGDDGVCNKKVPSAGGTAPTSTTINPTSGTWYVFVTAYSNITPPGGSGGSVSEKSSLISVDVP